MSKLNLVFVALLSAFFALPALEAVTCFCRFEYKKLAQPLKPEERARPLARPYKPQFITVSTLSSIENVNNQQECTKKCNDAIIPMEDELDTQEVCRTSDVTVTEATLK